MSTQAVTAATPSSTTNVSSAFQSNKRRTPALFATLSSRSFTTTSDTGICAPKILCNVAVMNQLNNNNNNNNNNPIISQTTSNINNNNSNNNNNNTTMASNSNFAKSLLASFGAGGSNGLSSQQQSQNCNINNNNNMNVPTSALLENGGGHKYADDIVVCGNLRKLKTMRKKYFVLYKDSSFDGGPKARLEYFDSVKKYRLHSNHPKRSIALESCFNINRRTDTKQKCVIALYTHEDSFCIVCDGEEELNKWLNKMLSLKSTDEDMVDGEPPKPTFAHVWSVQVQKRGLATDRNIIGCYHLCLTDKSLTLNRYGASTNGEHRQASVELPLSTIRKCGHLESVFYMEVGRQSVLGAGELWMETENASVAQNMHHTIINASSKPTRPRSQSANEASKPISMMTRRQTQQQMQPINFSPSSSASSSHTAMTGMIIKRDRSDSLPSRNRTISDGNTPSSATTNITRTAGVTSDICNASSSSMPPPKTLPSWNRPMSNRPNQSPLSPSICSESDGSSISIDEPDGVGISQSSSHYHQQAHLASTPDDMSGYFPRFTGQNHAIMEESDEYCNTDKFGRRNSGKANRLPSIAGNNTSLSLPIAAPSTSGHKRSSSSDMTGINTGMANAASSVEASPYLEMYSPSGSSPGDPMGAYLPMSPVVDMPRSLYTGSSSTHSRASSITEENMDVGANYVDMDMSHQQQQQQNSAQFPHHYQHPNGRPRTISKHGHGGEGGLSSAASSSSITSGTPSTDTRFADYPLEKVYSKFGPDIDENDPMSERPLRANSVGSRLEHNKRKMRMDPSLSSSLASNSSTNSSRTRAYSVGSKVKVPRTDHYRTNWMGSPAAQIALFNSVHSSQYSSSGNMMMMSSPPNNNQMMMVPTGQANQMAIADPNNNNSNNSSNNNFRSHASTFIKGGNNNNNNNSNKKSSSVPMLDSTFGGQQQHLQQSPKMVSSFMEKSPMGSNERVTDFVMLDFSAVSIGKISESDDYVLSDGLTPSPAMMTLPPSCLKMEHDYLNMEPVGKAIPPRTDGYVEMRPVGLSSSTDMTGGSGGSVASSPVKQLQLQKQSSLLSTSASSSSSNNNNNIITKNNNTNTHTLNKTSSSLKSNYEENDYLDMRGRDIPPSPKTALVPTVEVMETGPTVTSETVFNTINRMDDSSGNDNSTIQLSSKNTVRSSSIDDYMQMTPINLSSGTIGGVLVSPTATITGERAAASPPMQSTTAKVTSVPLNINTAGEAKKNDISIRSSSSIEESGYLEMSFSSSTAAATQLNSPNSYGKKKPSTSDFQQQRESYINGRKLMTSNRSMPIDINYNNNNNANIVSRGPSALRDPIAMRYELDRGHVGNANNTMTSPFTSITTPNNVYSNNNNNNNNNYSSSGNSNCGSAKIGGWTMSSHPDVGGAIGVGEVVMARKCLVDGTTGTIKLSEEAPKSRMQPAECDDYVNCGPQQMDRPKVQRAISLAANSKESDGDYVLMNPSTKPRGKSLQGSSTSIVSLLTGGCAPLNSANFRTIPALEEQQQMSISNRSSPYDLNRMVSGGGAERKSAAYQPLPSQIISRPSSVNSDKITSRISSLSLNRPNSVNSDRLSTISSSSSSTSTLCGGIGSGSGNSSSVSSSTTTLCGGVTAAEISSGMMIGSQSKSQSPITLMRLQSEPATAASAEQGSQILSRPPSVTSCTDKELHYASLDLPNNSSACGAKESGNNASNSPAIAGANIAPLAKQEPDFVTTPTSSQGSCGLKRNRSSTDSSSSSATTTPSPNVNSGTNQPVLAFNYAQIDFVKSDAMKQVKP